MKNYSTLICVLGWEDRFFEGIKADISDYSIKKIILISYAESSSLTSKSKDLVNQLSSEIGIDLSILELEMANSVLRWKKFEAFFSKKEFVGSRILLDISTMPRETIWSILFFLNLLKVSVDYVYHSPKKYNSDWLSKEPGKPRLLFKHSGVSKLGFQTALVIVTGFETERTRQLVQYFEPKVTYLGIQKGEQYNNFERNNLNLHGSIMGYTSTKEFYLDAYGTDHGLMILRKQVEELKDEYNVIIASLGPKPTSIAIYKLYLLYPDLALAYVPAKEFNENYSEGIGKKIQGTFS